MKLIQFFLKSKNKNDYASLYAVSNNNDLIESFKKYRNMDIFITRFLKLNNDDFKAFQKKFSKYFLKSTSFKTYDINSSLPKVVHIITTYNEELQVFQKSDSFISTCLPDFPEEMYIFEEEYFKILKDLKYYDISGFYAKYNLWQYNNMMAFEEDDGNIDYKYIGDELFSIDELNLFIRLFGNTIKIKEE